MNYITEKIKHMTRNWITLKLMTGDSERSLFFDSFIMLSLGPHFGRRSVDTSQAQALHLVPKLHISTATRTYGRISREIGDRLYHERKVVRGKGGKERDPDLRCVPES